MASFDQQKNTNLEGSSSGMFKPTSDKVDVFWNWNSLKDKNNRKSVTCDFCKKNVYWRNF